MEFPYEIMWQQNGRGLAVNWQGFALFMYILLW